MSASPSAREGRILEDLSPVLAPLGLLVEDVSVTPAGKRRLVRILVDRDLGALDETDTRSPVPPLDLDQVAAATRLVSDRLDAADTMGEQPYVLEVSSPGVGRPLTLPRHFRRNVGRLVSLTTTGGQSVTGRILAADRHGIQLEVCGEKGAVTQRALTYAECGPARVQVEFNRAATDDDGGDS